MADKVARLPVRLRRAGGPKITFKGPLPSSAQLAADFVRIFRKEVEARYPAAPQNPAANDPR